MFLSGFAFLLNVWCGFAFILSMKTDTGEVDLVSVVNHVTLLEQKLNIIEPELAALKAEQKTQQAKIAELETKLGACLSQQTKTGSQLSTLKSEVSSIQNTTTVLSKTLLSDISNNSASTFIRWGRTSCPPGNDIIYKGYAAGNNFANKAAAGNMLCLSDQPIYANHTPTVDATRSRIVGTEYETGGNPAFNNLHDDDMPCVVCHSQTKQSSVMVPGRNQCFPGWSREYWGYLLGPKYDHASSEYICVDTDAETVVGSGGNTNGNVLLNVEAICTSLACPPYKNGWELTCAVCSK